MTRSQNAHHRRGTTLVEMLIVLVLLAVLATVASLSLRPIEPPSPDDPRQVLADSARVAAKAGRMIHVSMVIGGRRARAALAPDGSVVADSAYAVGDSTQRSRRAP